MGNYKFVELLGKSEEACSGPSKASRTRVNIHLTRQIRTVIVIRTAVPLRKTLKTLLDDFSTGECHLFWPFSELVVNMTIFTSDWDSNRNT